MSDKTKMLPEICKEPNAAEDDECALHREDDRAPMCGSLCQWEQPVGMNPICDERIWLDGEGDTNETNV